MDGQARISSPRGLWGNKSCPVPNPAVELTGSAAEKQRQLKQKCPASQKDLPGRPPILLPEVPAAWVPLFLAQLSESLSHRSGPHPSGGWARPPHLFTQPGKILLSNRNRGGQMNPHRSPEITVLWIHLSQTYNRDLSQRGAQDAQDLVLPGIITPSTCTVYIYSPSLSRRSI